jgi:predicted transcriptional regulator
MANAPGPAASEQLDEPLHERDLDPEDLAALRAAIREGRAEVARGEGIPLDEVLAEFDVPDAE